MQQQFEALLPKSKKAALVFRAINNRYREQILKFLLQNPRSAVTTIYCKLRLEQSVASQHLAILRKQGIVKADRDGKFIYYSVNEEKLKQLDSIADWLLRKEGSR